MSLIPLDIRCLTYPPQPESLHHHVSMLLFSHAQLGGQTQFLQPNCEDEAW